MKKRVCIVVAVLLLILLGIGLALPRTHFAIVGWAQGEAYFAGQPTSYWAGALKKDPFIGNQGDVGKTLREGCPAAIPVLCQLLADEEDFVRTQAKIALSLADWAHHDMTQAVAVNLACETTPDLFQR